MATAEGMFIGTTSAMSRHERVVLPGRGVREPATMVVDETSVRWERAGEDELRVAGTRLLGVSLERRVVGSFQRPSIVTVSWHAGSGDRFATAFQPRHRVETHDLLRAVQRLMVRSADSQKNDETTPDGPL